MAEYIRRDELLFNFREIMTPEGENELADEMYNIVFQMAAYDVEPVRHGKWLKAGAFDIGFWVCSNCDLLSQEYKAKEIYNYCTNCGARMDGET